MDILLFVVTILVTICALFLLIEGVTKGVPSCYKTGGVMILIPVFVVVGYLINWLFPLVFIYGILGVIMTMMGTFGENDAETFKMGIVFCIIGVIFYIISFYYWYQSGWYTSLAFTTFTLCCLSLINSMQCDSNRKPVLSLSMSLLFVIITAYVWITTEIDIVMVCVGGVIVSLLLKALWKIIYERDYGYFLREPWISWLLFSI